MKRGCSKLIWTASFLFLSLVFINYVLLHFQNNYFVRQIYLKIESLLYNERDHP